MESETDSRTPSARSAFCTILIKGHLDPGWSEWLGGLTITPAGAEQNHTLLSGPIADQAALHGILSQIGSLGLALLSVDCRDSPAEPPGAMSPGITNSGEADTP